MITESVSSDIVVVGGGLAGIGAAIGAARRGSRVSLVQNRPVLGGNSSSEVRVWVCGATAHGTQLFARETGIMGELFVENQFRNPDGNPYYWDLLLLEKVRAESNIQLFLNTDVTEIVADGPSDHRAVRSVTGWMSGSERRITFTAPTFIDCSGDGIVALLAGADFMTGREPRSMFGESWAPEIPDDNMLGSTILFYSKDVGHPQKFVRPSFAVDIASTSIPENRVIRQTMNGCDFWWIEWGGELDIVDDNERIRDELQAVCYGMWDYIKNSGRFDADTLSLEWIGAIPGKREYRRFVGDHILTQHDVLEQRTFEDRIGFGGWSIDLHPPGGVYASEHGSRHWHPDGVYHLPLRSLYPRTVDNLWLAGRDASVSHVAFGSTRVMATCAVMGEAAGIAASLAGDLGVSPRELAIEHLPELHRAMLRADASLMGVAEDDPADLALAAHVEASSVKTRLASVHPAEAFPLDDDLAFMVPVQPVLDGVEVLVDAGEDTELSVSLHGTTAPQNYLPGPTIQEETVPVSRGRSWVRLPLQWEPDTARNAFIVLTANPALRLYRARSAEPGTVTLTHRDLPENERFTEQWRAWKETLHGHGICFRMGAATSAFSVKNIRGGYARPYGGPNMWVSETVDVDAEPWVELRWDEPRSIATVDLILDDDVNEDLINLHHHHTDAEIMPTLAQVVRIEARTASGWNEVGRVEDNRRRHCSITLSGSIITSRLRVTIEETNDSPAAHLVAVRAYGA